VWPVSWLRRCAQRVWGVSGEQLSEDVLVGALETVSGDEICRRQGLWLCGVLGLWGTLSRRVDVETLQSLVEFGRRPGLETWWGLYQCLKRKSRAERQSVEALRACCDSCGALWVWPWIGSVTHRSLAVSRTLENQNLLPRPVWVGDTVRVPWRPSRREVPKGLLSFLESEPERVCGVASLESWMRLLRVAVVFGDVAWQLVLWCEAPWSDLEQACELALEVGVRKRRVQMWREVSLGQRGVLVVPDSHFGGFKKQKRRGQPLEDRRGQTLEDLRDQKLAVLFSSELILCEVGSLLKELYISGHWCALWRLLELWAVSADEWIMWEAVRGWLLRSLEGVDLVKALDQLDVCVDQKSLLEGWCLYWYDRPKDWQDSLVCVANLSAYETKTGLVCHMGGPVAHGESPFSGVVLWCRFNWLALQGLLRYGNETGLKGLVQSVSEHGGCVVDDSTFIQIEGWLHTTPIWPSWLTRVTHVKLSTSATKTKRNVGPTERIHETLWSERWRRVSAGLAEPSLVWYLCRLMSQWCWLCGNFEVSGWWWESGKRYVRSCG